MTDAEKRAKAEDLIADAEMAVMMGNEAEAINKFIDALSLHRENAEAWNNLGSLLGSNNRHEDAQKCFANAVKLSPRYVKAWRGLAVSEKNLKHYARALEICDHVETLPGGMADDIRQDTLRRQREHIDPPRGNPYDSTTEFAKKYSNNAMPQLRMPELLTEMCAFACSNGLLPSAEIKHVPELCAHASDVTFKVIMGIQECAIQEEGEFNVLKRFPVVLAFSIYAGMGAALEWDRDWPGLQATGIYEKLVEKNGIFAMDEYVSELYTGKPFSDPANDKLTQMTRIAVKPIVAKILNVHDEIGDDDFLEFMKANLPTACVACYWFGVSYAMYKIVGR